jgi:hypothetical protein
LARKLGSANWPTPALLRCAEHRPAEAGDPSDISWRRNKGAIGLAWRNRKACFVDLFCHWDDHLLTESEWKELCEPDDELGMSLAYDEYLSMYSKYRAVLIQPIYRQKGRRANMDILGFVTVELTARAATSSINDDRTAAATRSAANAIAKSLEGAY